MIELVQVLAWPAVACVAIGVGAWAFNAWRHPTIAETTLKALAANVLELDKELGKLKVAVAHGNPRAQGFPQARSREK